MPSQKTVEANQSKIGTFIFSSGGFGQKKGKETDPIRRLALGILLQALRDCFSYKNQDRQQEEWKQDAVNWLISDETHLGSLGWVCEVLHIDSDSFHNWICYHMNNADRRKDLAERIKRFQMPH